jgi:hypothetical protein
MRNSIHTTTTVISAMRNIVRGVVVIDCTTHSDAKQAHSPFRDRQVCLGRLGDAAFGRSQSFAGWCREALRPVSRALALAAGAWRAMYGAPPASVCTG